MVKAVYLYVEGGGDTPGNQAELQQGFSQFFQPLRDFCKKRDLDLQVKACGGIETTYKIFCDEEARYPDVLCLLLVDADSRVTKAPYEHLQALHPNWNLDPNKAERYHLMAQAQEAWILADPEAVAAHFGISPREFPDPEQDPVEDRSKKRLGEDLNRALKPLGKKYKKIRHGAALLRRINSSIVIKRASYCERIFSATMATVDKRKP